MKSTKKILVLGYFGYENNQLDGQTIKTRNIYDLLKSKEKEEDYVVSYFDTQTFQSNKLNVLKMFSQVSKCDKLIYIGAHNNLKYFFPIIASVAKFKKIDIHYILVGGWLADFISDKKYLIKKLRNISGLYPQTKELTQRLISEYKFNNVVQLNNFRLEPKVERLQTKQEQHEGIRLVFMARVHPMKGVDLLFDLAKQLSTNNMANVSIDIYGPIIGDYNQEFYYKIGKAPNNISYKGALEPNDISNTLRGYDLMLFPTKFYTEGFPGTVLDAYIAGLPVVATKWKYADEFVDDNVCGIISEFDNDDMFIDKVIGLITDKDKLNFLKQNTKAQAEKYSAETAWRVIKEKII